MAQSSRREKIRCACISHDEKRTSSAMDCVAKQDPRPSKAQQSDHRLFSRLLGCYSAMLRLLTGTALGFDGGSSCFSTAASTSSKLIAVVARSANPRL